MSERLLPGLQEDDGIVRIVNQDCIAGMRGLEAASVDCVLTDPPYGMGYVSAWRKRSPRFDAIENDGKFDLAFNVRWLTEAHRVMKDDTHLYVFTDDGNLGSWRDVIGKCGFTVKRTLVWVKNAWTSGDLEGDYGHQTEFVVFAHKGRRPLLGNRIGNVIDARRVDPNALQHPTQKPVEVLTPLIECSTERGGSCWTRLLEAGRQQWPLGRLGDAASASRSTRRITTLQ